MLVLRLGVVLLLATAGCDGVNSTEMEALRKRVELLESRPELPIVDLYPTNHTHPHLALSHFGGCGLPDAMATGPNYGHRGLVSEINSGSCKLASFSLLSKPRPGGPGQCPSDYDLVVLFKSPQAPVHLEFRGDQVYETGNVNVSVRSFSCEHGAGSIQEIMILPPEDAKKLIERNTHSSPPKSN